MKRPKKLGRLAASSLLAGGLLVIINLSSLPGTAAVSPYDTPSIESSAFNNYCMTDRGDYLNLSNQVSLTQCDGDYGQYWQYNPSSMQITFQHDQSYCLAPLNRTRQINDPAVLSTCSGRGIFWIRYHGGYKNRLSGYCLTSITPGDLLRQMACDTEPGQQWSDPYFRLDPSLCGNVVTADPKQAQCIGKDLMQIYPYYWNPNQHVVMSNGQTSTQWICLANLWGGESGWRRTASNPSGAYGIPQADPGYKVIWSGFPTGWIKTYYPVAPGSTELVYNSAGESSAIAEIKWGLQYIQGRYGTPCSAEATELSNGSYNVNLPQD